MVQCDCHRTDLSGPGDNALIREHAIEQSCGFDLRIDLFENLERRELKTLNHDSFLERVLLYHPATRFGQRLVLSRRLAFHFKIQTRVVRLKQREQLAQTRKGFVCKARSKPTTNIYPANLF